MISLFKRIFTWWNDSTIGTMLFTKRKGVKVGEDNQGNIYYREKDGDKRWVIYKGEVEASRIPPEWHAWLHYTIDETPVENPPRVKPWEKEHEPNPTGTVKAYFPKGSLYREGRRPTSNGDYEAWTPN
ncbi:NADH:ubiquinone oxidoreductase subunit NDUFA12 [Luteithermobacter gelatinilyticus]|uniref:NADH:ubiquinone oxidoreductase subunit NDUFA12 n=1 Tax=Luteithermobacter gelatinilyticus TaxID=2582913 RepID=UPI00110709F7|nr:NADH:ubiquinone oxidoreductase subunit NDUFA12 [Luteithermobacter gelatinilyticus]